MPFEATAPNRILPDFGKASLKGVHAEITRFNHRLRDTGLFEDEALARLIDSHPRDQLTICTMQPNPPATERWIAGDAHDLDGAALVQAVKTGALWVSPRRIMALNTTYGAMFRRLMAEYAEATGDHITSAEAGLILSSPKMGIYFHVDPAETMLWHIRGHKQIRVYPPREDYVTEAALEAILLKENLSDLPFHDGMEADCTAVEMAPGDAVAWPQHSPHRVLNGDDMNVSMSIEYSTVNSLLTNGVFYMNGRLNRMLGKRFVSRGTPNALKPAYLMASKALKTLMPPKNNIEAQHKRCFDVDLSAPGCVRWRDGMAPYWAS